MQLLGYYFLFDRISSPKISPARNFSIFSLKPKSNGRPFKIAFVNEGGIINQMGCALEKGVPPPPQNHLIPNLGSLSQSKATIAHLSSTFL